MRRGSPAKSIERSQSRKHKLPYASASLEPYSQQPTVLEPVIIILDERTTRIAVSKYTAYSSPPFPKFPPQEMVDSSRYPTHSTGTSLAGRSALQPGAWV